jgi:hypothetical protein
VQGESAGAATRGPFNLLRKALNTLKDLEDRVQVQFVVRQEDGPRSGEGGVR